MASCLGLSTFIYVAAAASCKQIISIYAGLDDLIAVAMHEFCVLRYNAVWNSSESKSSFQREIFQPS
jgi:hypothetical protein